MKFEKRVKQIESAERDVDKVLKAARLQRNPKDNCRFEAMMDVVMLATLLLFMFGIMALFMLTVR